MTYLKLDDLRAIVAEAVDQHDTFTRFLVRLQDRLDEMAQVDAARLERLEQLRARMVVTEPFGIPHLPDDQSSPELTQPIVTEILAEHARLQALLTGGKLSEIVAAPDRGSLSDQQRREP